MLGNDYIICEELDGAQQKNEIETVDFDGEHFYTK